MDDLERRIERGRRAVALAREERRDTSVWELELARLEAMRNARDVARRTGGLLGTRGWCLWRCANLGGDTVVVCRDELSAGYPNGYPVYTEAELTEIGNGDLTVATLRLLHEAKKQAGAVILEGVRGGA